MINKWKVFFVLIPITCFIIFADSSNVDTAISSDSTRNLESAEQQSNKKSETKKETKRKRKRREKIVIDKEASIALHKSMLSAGTTHKHGFSHLKVHRGKAPLKPQTFCPVMGGPIDTTAYVDYKGMRIYFCCEGCIYNFKLTPNLYLKTLKRYGEKPGKIPEE